MAIVTQDTRAFSLTQYHFDGADNLQITQGDAIFPGVVQLTVHEAKLLICGLQDWVDYKQQRFAAE